MAQVRRIATVGLAVLIMATALAACGSSGDSTDASSGGKTGSTVKGDAASAYVGLSKKAAIAKAEADDRPWRIGREDDEQFMLTQDFVENRVTFEIDDGKVTKATLG